MLITDRLVDKAAWVVYVVFTAAALWTHNTAVLFWIAANLFVLGQSRLLPGPKSLPPDAVRRLHALKHWLLAQLGVLALWSPWLLPFLRQAAGVDREFWIPAPTWSTVAGTLNTFLSAFLPQGHAWRTLTWLACGTLIGSALFARRARPVLLALLGALLVVPFAGELLVSLRRPIFYTRTLIWASLPLYLLLAAGTAATPVGGGSHSGRRLRAVLAWGAAALLVTANVRSLHNYYTTFRKEAWDETARYVAQQALPDDLVLFNAGWVQLPFDFYFDTPTPVEKRGLPVDAFDRGILEPKMTEQDLPHLHALLEGHARVWLVYSHHWYTDPEGLIPAALAAKGRLTESRRFRGIEVHRYELPAP